LGKYDGKVTIGTALDLLGLKKGVGGVSGALGGLSGVLTKLGGLLAATFSVTAIVNFSKEAIQLGSDLQEVQNVVDVTFSTMNEQVNTFAKNAMYTAGLSETMAKQYTGTFGAMAKSFKFTEEQAFAMSTTLTQLTGDVASFYNISQDEAYTKLSAVFTGETEALKHLGVVMTENALNEFAMQKGMDKTVQKMTEQEKVALRYKFVLEQLSGASGDFTRTSGSWANQTRLLTVQFNQLKATIGQGLINALTPVLRVINNLIARLQVLANAFVKLTVELFGDASGGAAGASSTVADNYESAAESAGGIADETERAGKAAQKYLAGFDEIKKLGDSSGGGTGGAGGGGAGATGGNIDIPDVDWGKLDPGFEIDDETIKRVADIIRGIAEYIPVIVSGLGALKLGSFLADLVTANVEAKTLKESIALLGKKTSLISGITLAVTGITLETKGIISAVQEGLNGINFAEILGGGGTLIAGAALIGKTFGGALLGGGVGAIIAGLPMYVTGIYDAVVNGIQWLSAALIGVGATLTGAGIGAIIGACGGPIGAGIGALAGLVIGLLTDFFIWFWQKFDEIEAWFLSVPDSLGGWIAKIAVIFGVIPAVLASPITSLGVCIIAAIKKFDDFKDALADAWVKIQEVWSVVANWFNENVLIPLQNWFAEAWLKIQEIWLGVATWFNENVIIPIQNFFTPIVEWFSTLFWEIEQTVSDVFYNIGVLAEGCWVLIQLAWEAASSWFNENVIVPLQNFFTDCWNGICDFATTAWDTICGIWQVAYSWFSDNVITPIQDFFTDCWTGICDFATTAWTQICSVWQTAYSWFNSTVIQPVKTYFEDLWTGLWEKAKDAWKKIKDTFADVSAFFKGLLNGAIRVVNSGIKKIFSGVNSIINSLQDLSVAGVSPFAGLRTIHTPQIPYLAKGAVLPPNKPFLAMVGDQRHGTNIEAPLATIQEAVALVMQDMVASNIAGHEATVAVLREILEAVLGIHIGDDVIAAAVDRHRNKMAIVRGGAL